MRYLERLPDMSYPTVKPVPVFLNMNVLNPIGNCRVVVTEAEKGDDSFYGFLWLNHAVDENLYFYYLAEAKDKECFNFKGINLSEKKMRHVYPKGKVIHLPMYRTTIHRNPKTLRELVVGAAL